MLDMKNGLPSKQYWVDIAQIADHFRVTSRFLLLAWLFFYMNYTMYITDMFFKIAEPTTAQAAFVSTVVTALGSMSIWLGNIYMNSRIKYKDEPS